MVTLITFAFCEKEGIVGITSLELLGVSMVGVTGLDITSGLKIVDTLAPDDDELAHLTSYFLHCELVLEMDSHC